MKTTLYWDDEKDYLWYKNELGVWRVGSKCKWSNSNYQHWRSIQFEKSLTVNNFKEK